MAKKLVIDVATKTSTVHDFSAEDIAMDDAYDGHSDEVVAEWNRSNRNDRLAETDRFALADQTMTTEMTAYRQALRDLPSTAGWPQNVVWPTCLGFTPQQILPL
jgi:hypothetical protein